MADFLGRSPGSLYFVMFSTDKIHTSHEQVGLFMQAMLVADKVENADRLFLSEI